MKNFDSISPKEIINKTIDSLNARGYFAQFVETKEEALEKIKQIIPEGVSVMNGSSKTLEEIGYIDYLKEGSHGWINLHESILKETDEHEKSLLRKQSVLSDYYLGSVHALAESGEIIVASNTGSQLPHLAFTSPNLILIVGAQKITSNLEESFSRLKEYVFPLEDERMKKAGYPQGSYMSKILILNREPPLSGRKVHVILVNQKLGF